MSDIILLNIDASKNSVGVLSGPNLAKEIAEEKVAGTVIASDNEGIAIEVKSIKDTIDWYKKNSSCEVSYQDDTWALLKYENISLALVLPNSHPPHIAFEKDDAHKYGELKLHRDGTSSVYVRDPSNNAVEMLKLNK